MTLFSEELLRKGRRCRELADSIKFSDSSNLQTKEPNDYSGKSAKQLFQMILREL